MLLAVVLATLCCSTPGVGAEVSGSLGLGATHSDNIRLAASPDEESETIYQVVPSLQFTHDSQRIDTSVFYRLQAYRYADLEKTSSYHQFDGVLTGQLIQDMLSVELGATRTQSITNPDDVVPSSNLVLSDNRVDRDEVYVKPQFSKTLGRSVSVNADYQYTDVNYDDADVQDNTAEQANFGIENYKQGQGLTWAARYAWQQAEYDLSLPFEYRSASAELGYWLNEKARVFASGGKESAWDDLDDRSLQDPFWEAGFAVASGERLRAEFAAGKRSFGNSWRGEVDFTFRRGNLLFSYAETPTTSGFNRYNRGGLQDPDQPNDFLDRPGNSERYIEDRLQGSLNLNFRRADMSLVLFDEDRSGRYLADGTALPDESQRGGTASFKWRVGARTDLTASGSMINRKTANTPDENLIRGIVGANYRLGATTQVSLSYSYDEQDATEVGTGRDYVANVVSLFLTFIF